MASTRPVATSSQITAANRKLVNIPYTVGSSQSTTQESLSAGEITNKMFHHKEYTFTTVARLLTVLQCSSISILPGQKTRRRQQYFLIS